ncbi:agglutinin-like protein 5, partial [Limulus polyphemus]|uniref:Agglutinin-like protein 5 n=1 Tax=Limulus polyphemus TaxID=6850 RepID=A0ABM1TIS5_LIMPO
TSPDGGMDGLDNTAFQEENGTTVVLNAGQHSSPSSGRSSVSNGTETTTPPGGAKLEETPVFRDEHRQRAVVSFDEEFASPSDVEEQAGMVNFAFESEEVRDSDKSTVDSDETEVADKASIVDSDETEVADQASIGHEDNRCSPEDHELDNKYLANGNGQVLNQNGHTEIAIPDDALINFNTGRVRAKRKPKSRESPTEEKIPLEYIEKDLSPFTDYNDKAQEAQDNVKETNLHNEDQKDEGIPVNSPVTSEKQTNGTGKSFEEYFIPTNTHKKFLRGEKLYLAQNTRKSKPNWKRIILCGFITIIIAIAILAGILAATGILMSESEYSQGTEQPEDGPLPSRASGSSDASDEYSFPPPPQNSPHSGSIPPSLLNSPQSNKTLSSTTTTTTQEARTFVTPSTGVRQTNESVPPTITVFLNHSTIPVRIVPNAVRGEFTILDLDFVDALKDNTSSEFVSLATELELELKKIFSKKGSDPNSVKVTSFRPGSVVVRFTATWNTSQAALSAPVTKTVIQRYLEVKNESLAGHHINLFSIKTEEIANECQFQNGGCSYYCSWNDISMVKTCTCPEGYRLHEDRRTCINDPISTTMSPSSVRSITYASLDGMAFPTTAVSSFSGENVGTSVRTEEMTSGINNSTFLDSENTFLKDVSQNSRPAFDTTIANPATTSNQSTTTERTTTPKSKIGVSGDGTLVYYPRENVNILRGINDSSLNSTRIFPTESSSESDGTELSSGINDSSLNSTRIFPTESSSESDGTELSSGINDSSLNSTRIFPTESSSESDGTELSTTVSFPNTIVEEDQTVPSVSNNKDMSWNSDNEYESPWEALGFFFPHTTGGTNEGEDVGGVENNSTSTELSHSEASPALGLVTDSTVDHEIETIENLFSLNFNQTHFNPIHSDGMKPEIETNLTASENFTSSSNRDDEQILEDSTKSSETQIPEYSTNVSELLENPENHSSGLPGTSESQIPEESTTSDKTSVTTSHVIPGLDITASTTAVNTSDERLRDNTENISVLESVNTDETDDYEVSKPITIHSSSEMSTIQTDASALTTAFPSNDNTWSKPMETVVSEHQTEDGLEVTKFKTVTSFDERQGTIQSNEPEETTNMAEDSSTNNHGVSRTVMSLTDTESNSSSLADGTTDNMLTVRNLQFNNQIFVTKNGSLDEAADEDALQNDTSTSISLTTENTNIMLTSLGLLNETKDFDENITMSTIIESKVEEPLQKGQINGTDNGVEETTVTSTFNITETFFRDFVSGTKTTLEANVTKPVLEEIYATTLFEEDDKSNQNAKTVKDFSSEGTNNPKYSDVELDQRNNTNEEGVLSGESANTTSQDIFGILNDFYEDSATQVTSTSIDNSTRMERKEGGMSSQNDTIIIGMSNSSEKDRTLKTSDNSSVTNLIDTKFINPTLPFLLENATLDQLDEDNIVFANSTSKFPTADQSDLFHFNEGKTKVNFNNENFTKSSDFDETFLINNEDTTNEPDFNTMSTLV